MDPAARNGALARRPSDAVRKMQLTGLQRNRKPARIAVLSARPPFVHINARDFSDLTSK
jgi:hypothetical protein